MMFACPETHQRLESECGNMVTAVGGADDASDSAADGALGASGDCALAAGVSAAKKNAKDAAKASGTAAEIGDRLGILVLCGSAPTNHFSRFSLLVLVSLYRF